MHKWKKKPFLAVVLAMMLIWIHPAYAMDLDAMSGENEREDGVSYVNAVSFGWGGGGASRPSSHAPSETDSLLPYGALELVPGSENGIPHLGGQKLDVRLKDGGSIDCSLAFFDGAELLEGEAVNTLCLTSQGAEGDWLFSGQMLRKLQTSGLDWVALQTRSSAVLVPVSGFLSGGEYDAWRRRGITDGLLQYRLTVTEAGGIQLEVQNGENWATAAPTSSGLNYSGITTIVRGEP